MNINYFDFYYTVVKTRNENRDIDYHYENDFNDYIDNNDFNTHNHYLGIKPHETILRYWRILNMHILVSILNIIIRSPNFSDCISTKIIVCREV